MTKDLEFEAGFLGLTRALLLLVLVTSLGCTDSPEPFPADDGPHALPLGADGKADNYVSVSAREFILTGEAHVDLPFGYDNLDDEDLASALDRVVQARLTVISTSIRSYIDTALREANGGTLSDKDRYFTYFRRQHSDYEQVDVLQDERARFSFQIELVGNRYLMSVLAPSTEGTTQRTFEVEVRTWTDPAPEIVTVTIRGSDSRDAFPRYDALFEDGVLSIAVHFGGDYNDERFDIETAKWMVDYLLEHGFEHPEEATFDDLHIGSEPFFKTIVVERKELRMEVGVFHSEMASPPSQHELADAMRESFATADIVIYSGHAGPGSGFVLDYHPRHEIRPAEFLDLPLADKYQIYVFDGCQTYRTYVDDLMKNERKTFENVDIVTTVNATPFGVGYQVLHQFITWLTLTDSDGNHLPLSWLTILRGVSGQGLSRGVHYGVHGVDDGPRLNPHASEGIACQPCQTDGDCGAGGNLCLGYSYGPACGVACATDTACPVGYRCARLYDLGDYWFIPKQCVRRDYVCP